MVACSYFKDLMHLVVKSYEKQNATLFATCTWLCSMLEIYSHEVTFSSKETVAMHMLQLTQEFLTLN